MYPLRNDAPLAARIGATVTLVEASAPAIDLCVRVRGLAAVRHGSLSEASLRVRRNTADSTQRGKLMPPRSSDADQEWSNYRKDPVLAVDLAHRIGDLQLRLCRCEIGYTL